jgi:uncharacterized protein (TIGR02611 family)
VDAVTAEDDTAGPERAPERPPVPRPRLVARLEAQREAYRERSRIVRALFVVAGFTLLAAGIVMIVTPGPAFVAIAVALAILSLEFAWAEKLLERSLEEAAKAQRRAAETTTTQRVLTAIAGVLAVAAIAAWWIWGDIPLVPG